MAVVDPLMSSQMAPEVQLPLPLRALSAMPSATQMAAINANKYANTMFRGGYLDVAQGASGIRSALGRRTGAYVGNVAQNADEFALGKSIFGKYAANKMKPRAAAVANPFRFDSVARLTGIAGDRSTPYTPFQGVSFILEKVMGSKRVPASIKNRFADDIAANPGKPLYAGGVLGRLSTYNKATAYESAVQRAADIRTRVPQEAARTRAQARAVRRGDAAAAKLSRLDENIMKVARQSAEFEAKALKLPYGLTATHADNIMRARGLTSVDDVARIGRFEAIARMTGGVMGERAFKFLGVMQGAGAKASAETLARVGKGIAQGLEKTKMSVNAAGALSEAVGIATPYGNVIRAGQYADDAANLLKTGNVKAIRAATKSLAVKAYGAGEKGLAARLGGTYLSTYGKAAGKAFSVYGWASLAYDVGKGVGKLMMGGVNTAKDAVKSFQGSINKPLFGAGFKDNEVAATSRARGVMAIQNSRLNARSMLGSESSMLAAHFG